SNVPEVCLSERGSVPTARDSCFPELDQPLWFGKRQRLKHNRIHNTENRRGRSDAERNSKDGDRSDSRSPPQCSEAIPEVLSQCIQDWNAAAVPVAFLHGFDASKLYHPPPPRFPIGSAS